MEQRQYFVTWEDTGILINRTPVDIFVASGASADEIVNLITRAIKKSKELPQNHIILIHEIYKL